MEGSRIVSLNGTGIYEAGGNKVVTLAGETLRQLAQRVYGNDQLWYVLAQANGLGDPDQEIGGGLQLEAPQVDVSRNDANTFKPYNPAEAIGLTTPSLPYIPPPPKCDALGVALMVVIAVMAAVVTWGAMTAPAAGAVGAATATGVSIGTGIYAGAVSGAVGSLAGQVAGSAMGVASFNWRGVMAGAVTGAITGGIGARYKSIGDAIAGAQCAKAGALALVGAGAGYVGQKVAGMDVSFSWREIAANTVGSLASASISHAVGLPPSSNFGAAGNFGADFANGLITGVVSLHTRRAFGLGGDVNYGRIALDAFGNAMGNAVARGFREMRGAAVPRSGVESSTQSATGSADALSDMTLARGEFGARQITFGGNSTNASDTPRTAAQLEAIARAQKRNAPAYDPALDGTVEEYLGIYGGAAGPQLTSRESSATRTIKPIVMLTLATTHIGIRTM